MNDVLLNDLLARYAAGHDPDLLAQLTEAFLPLSRAIAYRARTYGVEQEDLEQVAALALVKALQRFRPERGLRFTTYAAPTILGEVRNYIRDHGSAVRVNRDTRTQLMRLRQISDRLAVEKGREPTLNELAEAMKLSPEELLSLLDERELTQTVSLSTLLPGSEEELTLEDCLGQTDTGYERVDRQAWYRWALSQLTLQEQSLVRCRFEQQLNQRETARQMGISQMQVSRLERRLTEKLRRLAQEETI